MTRADDRAPARTRMTERRLPLAGVLFVSLTACIGDKPMVQMKSDGGASGGRPGTGGARTGGVGGPPSGGQSGLAGSGGSSPTGSGGAGNGGSAGAGTTGGAGGAASGGGGGTVVPGSGGQAGAATDGGVPADGAAPETPSAARLTLDREQVPFGAVTVGTASAASIVVVRNTGGTATGALTIGLAGSGATAFSAVTNTCAGMVLAPGASCSFSITFSPQTPAMATATLTVNGGATVSVSSTLTGTGEFASIVSLLDGALLTMPCNGATLTGYSCVNVGCGATGGIATAKVFPIGGMANTIYEVTFRVRGVVEGYLYQGGTRDQGMASPTSNPDFFHRGGQLLAEGVDGATYNSYQLDVAPTVPGMPATYYLNSIPLSPVDPSVEHLTFPIDYTKTIRVRGGGSVTFRSADNDCRMIMNCGPTKTTMCAAPRTVSLAGASPAPPASFVQPFRNTDDAYGQWMFIDVTSVAVAP